MVPLGADLGGIFQVGYILRAELWTGWNAWLELAGSSTGWGTAL